MTDRPFSSNLLLVSALCVLAGGCSIVPKDGPYKSELQSNAEVTLKAPEANVAYALVNLNPLVLDTLSKSSGDSHNLSQLPHRSGGREIRISVGDVLGVSIFEQEAGGLFIPRDAGARAGNFVTIPNQQVDRSGSIDVPYAGRVPVLGRTTGDVSNEIRSKLKSRAIDPQVVINFGERHGSEVSVLGDVGLSTRFELDPGGIKVLDAIARAAGPKDPPYETIVSIQRGGHTYQSPMTSIIRNPKENVDLSAGDVVYLSHEPKVFVVLGATASPGAVGGVNSRRFVFDNDNVSLTEALSKSGGLDPNHADPTAVFVLRSEPRELLSKMGIDVSAYAKSTVPTIYVANWSKADAFFLSNNFFMRDKDVIFVSEHPTSDFEKLTNAAAGVTGNFSNAATGSVAIAK